MKSLGVDVSVAQGLLMFICGKLSAKVSESFIAPTADMSIAGVRVRYISVDVSITLGLLMLIWEQT